MSGKWRYLASTVCENGCPDGYLGDHKVSCYWAGWWYLNGTEVKLTGVDPHSSLVCIQVADRAVTPTDAYLGSGLYTGHDHVPVQELTRTRYPDVQVQLDLDGPGGNIFAVMGRVTSALHRAGHDDRVQEFTADITSADDYHEALDRVGRWVSVR